MILFRSFLDNAKYDPRKPLPGDLVSIRSCLDDSNEQINGYIELAVPDRNNLCKLAQRYIFVVSCLHVESNSNFLE